MYGIVGKGGLTAIFEIIGLWENEKKKLIIMYRVFKVNVLYDRF